MDVAFSKYHKTYWMLRPETMFMVFWDKKISPIKGQFVFQASFSIKIQKNSMLYLPAHGKKWTAAKNSLMIAPYSRQYHTFHTD